MMWKYKKIKKDFKEYVKYLETKPQPVVLYTDHTNNKVYYLNPKPYDKKYKYLIKSEKSILIKPNKFTNQIKEKTMYDTRIIYCMKYDDFSKEFKIDLSLHHLLIPINKKFEIFYLLMKNYLKDNFTLIEYENLKTQIIKESYHSKEIKNLILKSIEKFNKDNDFVREDPYYVETMYFR